MNDRDIAFLEQKIASPATSPSEGLKAAKALHDALLSGEVRTEEDIEAWVATLPQGFQFGLKGRAAQARQKDDEARSATWGDHKKSMTVRARQADSVLREYLIGALEVHDHQPHYDVLSAYLVSITVGHRANKEV